MMEYYCTLLKLGTEIIWLMLEKECTITPVAQLSLNKYGTLLLLFSLYMEEQLTCQKRRITECSGSFLEKCNSTLCCIFEVTEQDSRFYLQNNRGSQTYASYGKMLLKLEELYHCITLALPYVLIGHIFIARGKQYLQYDYSSRNVKKQGLLCRHSYDHDFFFFFG